MSKDKVSNFLNKRESIINSMLINSEKLQMGTKTSAKSQLYVLIADIMGGKIFINNLTETTQNTRFTTLRRKLTTDRVKRVSYKYIP